MYVGDPPLIEVAFDKIPQAVLDGQADLGLLIHEGQITHQELRTPRLSSKPLAEHRFLGFVVLVSGNESTDLSSHIAVKFRRRDVDVCSIFGCCHFDYPKDWTIEFNRVELEPRWDAWEPILDDPLATLDPSALMERSAV